MAEPQSYDNNTCVVCFKNVEYYSIGECDHPVCFECSTRMRVLCLQNECPICRQVLSRVVFTDTVEPYKELRNQVFTDRLFERQFKIGFCSEEIKQAYELLLENRCRQCSKIPPFRTFSQLSDHMRKVHERYYCDLCVKHLRIFTAERKCYTRQELAHHRRKGDLDDTSHRGHPLCEFCEERFMDADELYRHLRKEHLYCHLCDADGRNLYYASHQALAHHFRTDHFLCEEGDCADNHLTAVFRTEIDLKAHKATVHGRGMTRNAARQARTIEVQFNITPHSAQMVQRAPRDRERETQPPEEPLPAPPPAPRIDTRSDEQFPRLSAAAPAHSLVLGAHRAVYKSVDGLARTNRNFPTLGGAPAPAPAARPATQAKPAAAILRTSKPGVSIQLQSQGGSASNFRLTAPAPPAPRRAPAPLDDDDFPSLSARDDHPSLGAATHQPPKVAIINSQEMQAMQMKSSQPSSSHKKPPASSGEAFPALSATAAPSAPPQWITISKDKGKLKAPKPDPPPQPREPAFNHVADFPTLPVNTKKSKKSSQPQPVPARPQHAPARSQPAPARPQPAPARPQPAPARPQPAPQPPPETKASKKEKKKQNARNAAAKENSEPETETPMYINGFSDKFTSKQIKEAYTAAMNDSNPTLVVDKKIKTINDGPSANDNKRNTGNGDFALAQKDYPPLSGSAGNAGGRGGGAGQWREGGAPPGFGAPPPCDGLTFTNSSGQTFPAPLHAYIPPPDFERRNRELVQRFVAALGSARAVEDFKVASRAFRDDLITAEEFYAHCKRAMRGALDDVFPDLVALLPDIRKQQELASGRPVATHLAVCAVCGQLLAPEDRLAHDAEHWPPLH